MTPKHSVSRADLLRGLQVGIGADGVASLGFAQKPDIPAVVPVAQPEVVVQTPPVELLPLRTAVRRPCYWYLHQAEPLSPEQLAAPPPASPPVSAGAAAPAAKIEPLRWLPDRQPGDWQTIWDQHLPGIPVPGRIDVSATVQRLAQGRPYRGWVRRPCRQVRQLVVLFERSLALRPIWSELPLAWRSLCQQLDERLRGYYLPAGPDGPALVPETGRSETAPCIPPGASVLLIGTFGGLHTGQMSAVWSGFMRRLRRRGHPLQLLSWCPLRQLPAVPCVGLSRPSQVAPVLAALSQAWLPELAQLRRLRLAVPGASLLDELRVYQHAEVQTEAGWLWLRPVALQNQLRRYAALPERTQRRIEAAVAGWQYSLGQTARELDRLQRNLLQRPPRQDYAGLHRLASRVEQELAQVAAGATPGQAYRLLQSMLLLAESLADDDQLRPAWGDLLRVAQQVARATGQRLPLHQQGLNKAQHWLTQYHFGLRCYAQPPFGRVLLSLQGEPYDEAHRRVWSGDMDPASDRLLVRDQTQRYELRALTKPDWADSIAYDSGVIRAVGEQRRKFVWRAAEHGTDWQ
ncbi:MAG: hypothetical protein AAFO09_02800 [Pseudomonadota bacterium]